MSSEPKTFTFGSSILCETDLTRRLYLLLLLQYVNCVCKRKITMVGHGTEKGCRCPFFEIIIIIIIIILLLYLYYYNTCYLLIIIIYYFYLALLYYCAIINLFCPSNIVYSILRSFRLLSPLNTKYSTPLLLLLIFCCCCYNNIFINNIFTTILLYYYYINVTTTTN